MITKNQQMQKDHARKEAEQHMHYAAVDQMRDAILAKYDRADEVTNSGDRMRAKKVRDANNAYAGEE